MGYGAAGTESDARTVEEAMGQDICLDGTDLHEPVQRNC